MGVEAPAAHILTGSLQIQKCDALGDLERHVRKQIGHTFPWQISLNSSSLNFSPDDV